MRQSSPSPPLPLKGRLTLKTPSPREGREERAGRARWRHPSKPRRLSGRYGKSGRTSPGLRARPSRKREGVIRGLQVAYLPPQQHPPPGRVARNERGGPGGGNSPATTASLGSVPELSVAGVTVAGVTAGSSSGFVFEMTRSGGEPALAMDPVFAGPGPLTPDPSPRKAGGRGEPGFELGGAGVGGAGGPLFTWGCVGRRSAWGRCRRRLWLAFSTLAG